MAGDIASYIFGGTSGTPSYEELVRRRAIATANAARQRKLPTTLGEGMTYLGEAVGDRLESNRLTEAERAFSAAGKAEADRIYGPGSTAAAAPVSAAPAARPAGPPGRRVPTERIAPDVAPAGAIPGAAPVVPGGLAEGASPERDKLAMALMTSPQEVAQMDPTQGAQQAPPMDFLLPGSQSDDDVEGWKRSIGGIESSNRYDAVGVMTKHGQALGRYGVMEVNVPKWTQEALGQPLTRKQFLADSDAQDAVFKHKFGGYVAKYGLEKAARAWYGGEGNINNLNATDAHEKLSVHDYGRDFIKRLRGKRAEADDEAPASVQLASLGGAGGTMTDAPPIGMGGSAAQPRPSGEPEEPDPTVVEDIRPMSVAPNMMAQVGPEMFSPRRMSDALATTGPAARPPVAVLGTPATAAPAPAASDDYVYPKPVPPKPPDRIPETPREVAARRALIAQPTNPYVKQAAELAIKEEEDKRTFAQAREVTRYNADVQRYEADRAAEQTWLAGKKKREQDLRLGESTLAQHNLAIQKASEEAKVREQWGNLPTFVQKDLTEGRETAKASVGSLEALRNARETLESGTVVGTAAQAKLLYYKTRALAGDKDAERIVANTQSFQSSLGPAVMAAIKSYAGAQVSNADREYAAAMVGSDISLSEGAIRRIIDIGERSAKAAIAEHRERLDRDLKGNENLRRFFDVPDPKPALPMDRSGGGAAPAASVVDVGSEADAMKLPLGTKFKLPNGRTGTVR